MSLDSSRIAPGAGALLVAAPACRTRRTARPGRIRTSSRRFQASRYFVGFDGPVVAEEEHRDRVHLEVEVERRRPAASPVLPTKPSTWPAVHVPAVDARAPCRRRDARSRTRFPPCRAARGASRRCRSSRPRTRCRRRPRGSARRAARRCRRRGASRRRRRRAARRTCRRTPTARRPGRRSRCAVSFGVTVGDRGATGRPFPFAPGFCRRPACRRRAARRGEPPAAVVVRPAAGSWCGSRARRRRRRRGRRRRSSAAARVGLLRGRVGVADRDLAAGGARRGGRRRDGRRARSRCPARRTESSPVPVLVDSRRTLSVAPVGQRRAERSRAGTETTAEHDQVRHRGVGEVADGRRPS